MSGEKNDALPHLVFLEGGLSLLIANTATSETMAVIWMIIGGLLIGVAILRVLAGELKS